MISDNLSENSARIMIEFFSDPPLVNDFVSCRSYRFANRSCSLSWNLRWRRHNDGESNKYRGAACFAVIRQLRSISWSVSISVILSLLSPLDCGNATLCGILA